MLHAKQKNPSPNRQRNAEKNYKQKNKTKNHFAASTLNENNLE